MHKGNIEEIRIESDERGFLLWITTDEEEPASFRLTLDTAESLYDRVKAEIGPWLYERDAARYRAVVLRCDPDESGGYEESDPKHPTYHERMSAAWDSREGK